MVETKRHGDAFDAYYAMGASRSLVALAGDQKVSVKTAKKWSTEFNWQLRLTQRDLDINKRVEQKTNTQIVNTKADYRATIKADLETLSVFRQRFEALIADVADAIEKKEIKIDSIEGLDRTASGLKKLHDLQKDYINLDLKLIGEDIPDRSDLNIKLTLPEDLEVDDLI